MSKAASARYPTGCPTCGAEKGKPCRARTTHRVTDTHAARIAAVVPSAYSCEEPPTAS